MSTNLRIFLKEINLVEEKDAVLNTPTGKWASKLGFKHYQILNKTDECVRVEFTK